MPPPDAANEIDALAALFGPGQLDAVEVGLILGITKARVHQLERAALRKLRRHPVIRKLAKVYVGEEED